MMSRPSLLASDVATADLRRDLSSSQLMSRQLNDVATCFSSIWCHDRLMMSRP